MKKSAMIVFALLMLAVGKTYADSAASQGGLYTDITQPVSVATEDSLTTTKRAEVSTYGILGAVAFGDANIAAAARSAGITKISHIEKKTFNILMFYNLFSQETFTIYGE